MAAAPTSFDDLISGRIFPQILDNVLGNIRRSETTLARFKEIAELSTVSRSWKQEVDQYLYRVAILEYEVPLDYVWYDPTTPRCKWKSNIPNIAEANGTRLAKELRIIGSLPFFTVENLRNALEHFGFSLVTWDNVKLIRFTGDFINTTSDDAEERANAYADYFTSHLPNIREVNYTTAKCEETTLIQLFHKLTAHYFSQCTSFHISANFAQITDKSFSDNITLLEMSESDYPNFRHLPQFPVDRLRRLKVSKLSKPILWNIFKQTSPGCIHFKSLESIAVAFEYTSNKRVSIHDHCLELQFPCLQGVWVQRSYHVYTDFYSYFMHAPLNILAMLEVRKEFSKISPDIISCASHIFLQTDYHKSEFMNSDENPVISFIANNSRSASLFLRTYDLRLPSSFVMGASNLVKLAIDAPFVCISVVKLLLSQLAKLQRFQIVGNLVPTEAHAGNIVDESEYSPPEGDVCNPLSISLVVFGYYFFNECYKNTRGMLDYILPYLPKLEVLGVAQKDIPVFISYFKEQGRSVNVYKLNAEGNITSV